MLSGGRIQVDEITSMSFLSSGNTTTKNDFIPAVKKTAVKINF